MVREICVDAADQVHTLALDGSVVQPSNLGGLVLEIGGAGTVPSVVNPYRVVQERARRARSRGTISVILRRGWVWSMSNPGNRFVGEPSRSTLEAALEVI